MEKQALIRTIQSLQQRLPGLKQQCLKETPTRVIVIDPLLAALGWDVRDPDEVQLEYPTVDGKSVDYALKLNDKPVLLVEAKALGDSLDDVKAVTQVVGYAANDGIAWCVLTNGVLWRVYRTMEKCPAPNKLAFEVNIAPSEADSIAVEQIAEALWRLSREQMARGTLDELGEKIFTDGKVRKALRELMLNPPRTLLNLLRNTIGDEALVPGRIAQSLQRIALDYGDTAAPPDPTQFSEASQGRKSPSRPAGTTGPKRSKAIPSPYTEEHHTSGKPAEVVALYREIDRLCMSLARSAVVRRFCAKYISYELENRCFCTIAVWASGVRVWLRLKYNQLDSPPAFARDVSNVGHHGIGDVELRISNQTELDAAAALIRQSFEAVKAAAGSQ